MDDQAAADQVIQNMEQESVAIETLGLAPNSKRNKLFLKLKISKNSLINCGQHICPVCSKGFSSGKALGGHIRIHMRGGSKNIRHRKIPRLQPRNINRAKADKKQISKMVSTKAMDGPASNNDLLLINDQQQGNEKVSCCICNKDFRSMKSLFGHMRNHPERSWRGIKPPPPEKNSFCSSVSENDAAQIEVDQISFAPEKGSGIGSDDLLKSLPKWNRCGKLFTTSAVDDYDDEIPEAAYSLMKLARGNAFDSRLKSRKNPSSTIKVFKVPEEKRQSTIDKGKGKAKLKMMVKYADDARINDQFQKFLIDPDEKDGEIFPSQTQTPVFNPKNRSDEAPSNEKTSPGEGKHQYSKTQFLKTTNQTAEGIHVCSPKILDFDLNEPYVALDGEGTT